MPGAAGADVLHTGFRRANTIDFRETVTMRVKLQCHQVRAIVLLAVIPTFLCGCSGDETATGEKSPSLGERSHNSTAQAILDVLRRDAEPSKRVLTADESTVDNTRYTVNFMQRIHLEQCPRKFRTAYEKHLRAWQAILRFQIDHSSQVRTLGEWSKTTALWGTTPRTDFERDAFSLLSDVDSTYVECMRVAEEFGVFPREYRDNR